MHTPPDIDAYFRHPESALPQIQTLHVRTRPCWRGAELGTAATVAHVTFDSKSGGYQWLESPSNRIASYGVVVVFFPGTILELQLLMLTSAITRACSFEIERLICAIRCLPCCHGDVRNRGEGAFVVFESERACACHGRCKHQ